jgi:Carboxypeptidase regulatory-like domain
VRIAAAVLAVVVAQTQPPRDTRVTPDGAAGRIVGVVTTDETQPRPLRRARVMLYGQGPDMARSVITGDDGSFVFDRVPPGRFTAAAEKPGFVAMNYGATRAGRPGSGVQVAERQTTRIAIRLPRGAVITGTVIDVDGQPAAGISVSALARRFSGGGPSEFQYANAGLPSGATDDRGVYRIYGLPAGSYVVAVSPPQSQGLPPGTAGTAVKMMSRGTLGARTMLLSQVFHPGVAEVERATRVTVRSGEERSGVDVQLEYVPLATVAGTANTPAGLGAARVTLWRLDELARPQTGPVATADSFGRFQFPSVAPGRYHITARVAPPSDTPGGRTGGPAPGAQFASADVVVNGEDVDVSLVTQASLSISGRVAFEGERPAPALLPGEFRINMPLFAIATSGGWPIPPIVFDGSRFRLEGIAPGRYRAMPNAQGIRAAVGGWWLKSLAAGGRELLDAPLDLQQSIDDAVATFSDRASEVSGRLLDAGGAPVTDLPVVVFSVDRSTWFFNSRRIAGVRTDRDGRFAIRNLPPGEYRVAAADLDPNEWFDPALLERLLPAATPLTIAGTEQKTVDLRPR